MKYEIDIKYFIKNYFDGGANISGKNEGLSTRLTECAPISIHGYNHFLHVPLPKAMCEVKILRTALGVMQEPYNFIGENTKRRSMFQDLINLADDTISMTLKSLHTVRSTCR